MLTSAAPASAEPVGISATAAATCYGGAVSFPTQTLGVAGTRRLPSASSYYTTSSRCQDINIKFANPEAGNVQVRVCWVSHGTCNSWKTVLMDTAWKVIATDVLDGTRFRVEIYNYRDWTTTFGGQVAY
ncbi:hypothetical protein GCM10011608_40570 [Micromonospora sonchi]|uniref:Uncharacterized protein n=1 Tax=Micromonospora sonchi TaxID=1763543 RepID=A0A917U334_9ACTN|nr:hypothetical protein GCM10011608_40570 [Micromonospora sonchi]